MPGVRGAACEPDVEAGDPTPVLGQVEELAGLVRDISDPTALDRPDPADGVEPVDPPGPGSATAPAAASPSSLVVVVAWGHLGASLWR